MARFVFSALALGVVGTFSCSSTDSDDAPPGGAAGMAAGNGGASAWGGNGGSPSAGITGGGGRANGGAGSPAGGGGRAGDTSARGGGAGAGRGGAGAGSGGAPATGGGGGDIDNAGMPGEAGAAASGDLPAGDQGIAKNHPGDAGIDADPDVLFADDFEDYGQASELDDRWDAVYQNQYVGITQDPDHVYFGSQALEFTLPQQNDELSDATDKLLDEEQDVLFLRYYTKFMPPYDVVGSSHNGASISAHYFTADGMATPGVPADGTNKFLANVENWRGDASVASPGYLNVYVYHPDQRSMWGDHFYPNGEVDPNTSIPFDFGPDFVPRAQVIPELDRWYCYEYMLKANTPGKLDGRIAIWLDGELKADFMNLRLRDVASLKINRFGLSFHIHDNPNGEARKWYDNVVAAKSYIGPLVMP